LFCDEGQVNRVIIRSWHLDYYSWVKKVIPRLIVIIFELIVNVDPTLPTHHRESETHFQKWVRQTSKIEIEKYLWEH